jgi:chemotaxis protein CheZ
MSAPKPRLDDAQIYLDKVITSLHALDRHEKTPLLAILEYLSGFIRATRDEITLLRPMGQDERPLSVAADELEEIVAETAKAADAIMSAAEEVERLSAVADAAIAGPLLAAATRIYEVCAFQDITGQRIGKVVRAVQNIEERIGMLSAMCGSDLDLAGANTTPASRPASDAALLNGPQLAGAAKSQADIDRLFESLE